MPEPLSKLVERWLSIFHEMSNAHFGDRGEEIGNMYRHCAEDTQRWLRAVAQELDAADEAQKTEDLAPKSFSTKDAPSSITITMPPAGYSETRERIRALLGIEKEMK